MGLIDIDYFRSQPVGLKTSTMPNHDTLLQVIEEASDFVEDYCDRHFALGERVDVRRGNGRFRMALEEWPAASLTSVAWVDDNGTTGTDDKTLMTLDTAGILEWTNKINGPFLESRLYTVTYTAGYASVPNPVKKAVALRAAELLRPNFAGPGLRDVDMVPDSEQMFIDLLEKYRRRRLS